MAIKDINANQVPILIYRTDEKISVDVILQEQTVWLSIDQMAIQFGKAGSTINEYILNMFHDKDLKESELLQKIGKPDFQQKANNYYDLDMIMAVWFLTPSI